MHNILIFALLISSFLPFNGGLKTALENKALNKIFVQSSSAQPSKTTEKTLISAPEKSVQGQFQAGKGNVAIDLNSGEIIDQNNADSKLEIASITKLMTAYIALKDLPLDKTITVGPIENRVDDSRMGLVLGDEISVKDLLSGLLINSGSDAAQVLAIADSSSIDKFVLKMNERASALGLTKTHYANPVGWDDENNYSSAKDMAELARILLRNDTFREIVKTKNTTVYTKSSRAIYLNSTNILLANQAYAGVKTGYTLSAGECLVALNLKDNHEVLSVILGSNDRFGQTEEYFSWIYNHFSW